MYKLFKKTVLLSALILTAQVANASESAEKLAQKSGCLMCHGIQNAILGPAYKDIATKYKGDASAEARLIAKVKAGGGGVWGKMPMPPNSPQVKDDDIKTIVKWILTQA
ncbi:MAG: c-type cytochrome [Methylotenera sp.]|jgi:cytochrome c|uniref:c-type cytochrome n=1 Tax=Methylotenera sp. TaxID=2051956 RepID=UPI0027178ED1|nr:c-type cytochrome [Methylotenera sp.]MDO9152028.1 c-type cytochrome [Methylotenera sp.]